MIEAQSHGDCWSCGQRVASETCAACGSECATPRPRLLGAIGYGAIVGQHLETREGVLAWASVGAAAGDSVLAVQALDEVGVLLSDSRLLRYDDDLVRLADVVVTLGGEACPLEDGHRYEDWTHGSRVDRTIDEARRSRDLIATRVDRLAAELGLAHVA